jgi:hypothetical protein
VIDVRGCHPSGCGRIKPPLLHQRERAGGEGALVLRVDEPIMRRLAGGCPAASHFSCLAKKSNQKKARSTLALASAHDSPGAKRCFAKPLAHPLQRSSGSRFRMLCRGGQKNSLRSNSFWPKPRSTTCKSGAVEGRFAQRVVVQLKAAENKRIPKLVIPNAVRNLLPQTMRFLALLGMTGIRPSFHMVIRNIHALFQAKNASKTA